MSMESSNLSRGYPSIDMVLVSQASQDYLSQWIIVSLHANTTHWMLALFQSFRTTTGMSVGFKG